MEVCKKNALSFVLSVKDENGNRINVYYSHIIIYVRRTDKHRWSVMELLDEHAPYKRGVPWAKMVAK